MHFLNFSGLIYYKDSNHRFVWCNRNHLKLAGKEDLDEIVGLTDLDLPWKEAEALSYMNTDKRLFEQRVPRLKVIDLMHDKQKNFRTLLTSKIPCSDEKGNPNGLLGVSIDINTPDLSFIHQSILYGLNTIYKSEGNTFFLIYKDKVYHLTRKESECINFLCQAKTMKEIAIEMEISPRTVEEHIRNVKLKTGIATRSKLISLFIKNNINWI